MKLFANGCSFTAGPDLIHDEDTGALSAPADYCWPYVLKEISQNIDDVDNLAMAGNSNEKIVRTTLEYFDKNSSDNTVAVIQFSALHRLEFYLDPFKSYVNYCNTSNIVDSEHGQAIIANENLYGYHFDNGKLMEKARDNKLMSLNHKTAESAIKYLWSQQDLWHGYLKNVLVLQDFFTKRNIPYIFSTMARVNHVIEMDNMVFPTMLTTYGNILKNEIDKSKWTQNSFSVMCEKNTLSETDSHPNELGHKLIANKILKKLNTLYSI